MKHNVVVTGLGITAADISDISDFTLSLKKGISSIGAHESLTPKIKADISSFNLKAALDRLQLSESMTNRALYLAARAPLSAQISIVTALEAWQSAFPAQCSYDPSQISIIIAGHNIEQQHHFKIQQANTKSPEFTPASYALSFMDTYQIGLLSELLTIHGEGFTVGGASASGNAAIIQAHRQVASGISKACLVVGAMADLSPPEIQAFEHTGALLTDYHGPASQACRPFDADRNGFIYGQGCACLLIENENSARERHANIWAKILGGSICLDANKGSNPNSHGEARAMLQALKQADRSPDCVDYINAHGTSSLAGDEAEVEAIKEVFSPSLNKVWVNSTKSFTGHCLYAASVIEAAATLIQIKNDFIHPNLNLNTPIDSDCHFAGAHAENHKIKLALNNAFGFGGINTSVVFERIVD